MFLLPNWSEVDLVDLIANGQEEYLELDFKAGAALSNSKANEISKDVSAFANTIGGTILYGVDEDIVTRKASSLSPIDPGMISKEWVEQVINSRIQPRIPDIRIHVIDLPHQYPGLVVYAVVIPEGTTAHQAGDKKYYRRFNFVSEPMHDYEIRQVMGRAVMPSYSVWSDSWNYGGNPNETVTVGTKAFIVNVSDVPAHGCCAYLYIPENLHGSEPWNLVEINNEKFQRTHGEVGGSWYPGHPQQVHFQPRFSFDSKTKRGMTASFHMKIFDNFGLALWNEYKFHFDTLLLEPVRTHQYRSAGPVKP